MVYDKVNVIVMVTPYVESNRVKADRYLPENGQAIRHGDITVQSTIVETAVDCKNGIEIMKLTLTNIDCDEKTVYHIHFTKWTDCHIPDHAEFKALDRSYHRILDLLQRPPESDFTNDFTHDSKPKTLVHCSAGIGRTGTFIAIQEIIELLGLRTSNVKNFDMNFDIVNTVLELRRCRYGMVQTEIQLKFIYDYIRNSLLENKENKQN
jgi:protein tyrosine phosphatase